MRHAHVAKGSAAARRQRRRVGDHLGHERVVVGGDLRAGPHTGIDANAVVVVNQTAILGSPRAVKEGWAKADHTEYLAGAIPINQSRSSRRAKQPTMPCA